MAARRAEPDQQCRDDSGSEEDQSPLPSDRNQSSHNMGAFKT
jgi:hypothetical protein